MEQDINFIPLEEEETSKDFLPINGTDHIELFVGNALQAAFFYQHAFGFKPLAYRGLSTGQQETESYVLRQGKVTLVLTSPLVGGTDVGRHVDKHGDGVKSIALWVDDARAAFEATTTRGAAVHTKPTVLSDDHGEATLAAIKLYGDTVHVFVERKDYNGVFLPGYEAWDNGIEVEPVGFLYVDHMVANVDWGKMNQWVDFYKNVMGFNQLVSFDDKDISTEYTALMSKVMSNGNGRIKFPINEPAEGKKRSQIEEYLLFNGGAGVQHIAMATDDIVRTVTMMRRRGIEFLRVPLNYYETVLDRVGEIDEDLSNLAELGILIDRDDEGYLLQLFTKPLQTRPTLFFEIIQRKGARSFGKGNFKALFEAIEREQEIRGTL
jgi:4-hydroxyphenylpyruvate dioxygenase